MNLLRDLGRAVDRHRRVLAALAAAASILAALSAVSTTQTPTTTVVVAAREVPAGTALTAGDLALRAVRAEDVPDRAVTSEAAMVGKVTGSAISRNSVLTELSVVTGRTASAPGRIILAVKAADAEVVRLIAPGMRVALLTPGTAGGLLTDDALVVATPQVAAAGPLGPSGDRMVLVDVEAGIAERLVRTTATTGVTFALH